MKKSKLLLLSLLTPLLCLGVSFGADPIDINDDFQGYWGINTAGYDLVCIVPYNSVAFGQLQSINVFNPNNWNSVFEIQSPQVFNLLSNGGFCFLTNGYHDLMVSIQGQNVLGTTIYAYGYTLGNPSCENDLSYCLNQVNSLLTASNVCASGYNQLKTEYNALSGNYANCLEAKNILSGSLASCNSDLASCTNSCDTLVSQCLTEKESAVASYSGCLETNTSLQNYNDSLSSQLQECLESGTGGTGGNYIALFDLFRSENNTNYSLPIENNIWLPNGYRGYIDEGVLAIKRVNSLDSAYTIEDSDFTENVIGSYSVIYLFLMSSGLFLVFLYVIRRYFIGLKSIK